jgi:ABC-type Fe3+-siderophore transport system permease subunit
MEKILIVSAVKALIREMGVYFHKEAELPFGIVTSAVGVPVFIFLSRRHYVF